MSGHLKLINKIPPPPHKKKVYLNDKNLLGDAAVWKTEHVIIFFKFHTKQALYRAAEENCKKF